MTGLFNTMNTATSGLRAQQTALQTVGHNLANSNTEGYSRQRVTMAASIPHAAAGIGHIGTGVDISGITRIADDYVNGQLRDGNSSLARYETTSEMLGQLELIYNEPSDTGLATQMTEVFNTWNYLAANPELATAKTMVVRQSETFVSTLNHMGNQMDTLAADVENQINKQLEDFNGLTEQLYDTNKQIFEATVQGNRPNDLLDQQDRILADLNNIVGVKIERDDYNRALVSIKNEDNKPVELVTIDKSVNLSYDIKEAKIQVEIDGTKQSVTVERGRIPGLQVSLEIIQGKKEDLVDFATDFAKAINVIHTDGNAGEDQFFDILGEEESGILKVNPKLVEDPNFVNAGSDLNNSIDGDGSRAKAISDLQTSGVGGVYDEETMSFIPTDGETIFSDKGQGSTLFNRYNDMVTDMGIEKQQADNMAANQTDLVSLLDQRRESISGVDINEEVVNMIQYQSGFQANARVISVISDMLDTLINRTGV